MKKNNYTAFFAILALPLLAVTIFFAGGGHGSNIPLTVIFPLGFLGVRMLGNSFVFFFVFGVFQLSAYGYLLDRFVVKKTLPFIILIHILLTLLVYVFYKNDLF